MEFSGLIPDPGKMLMTPLGNPALAESSANLRAVRGVTLRLTGKQIKTFKHYKILPTHHLLITVQSNIRPDNTLSVWKTTPGFPLTF